MPKKNAFISELKTILSSNNYDFNDINKEVILIFISFFECLSDSRFQPLVHHKLSNIISVAFFSIISGCNTGLKYKILVYIILKDKKIFRFKKMVSFS